MEHNKIGPQELRRAQQILKEYRRGKAHLEQRLIDNEQFWKLRHWEQMAREAIPTIPSPPAAGW